MGLFGNRAGNRAGVGANKFEEEPKIEREYYIYRNGDSRSKPITYTHTCGLNGKYKDWNQLMNALTKDIKPLYEGQVKELWTANGRRRVEDMDQFETGFETEFVAVGDEGFVKVKGGYERLKHDRRKNSSSESSDDEHHRVYSKDGVKGSPRTRGHYRKSSAERARRAGSKGRKRSPTPDESFRIFLRPNDDPKAKPVRYDYSSKRDRDMGPFLERADEYCPLKRGGRAEFLFNMNGDILESTRELKENETYVVSDSDRFRLGTDRRRSRSKGEGPDDITNESRRRGYHRREPEHRVFNRKDQTIKEDLVLHVFMNGVSQDPKPVKFSKKQQKSKGIEHVLDECAREFGSTAHKSRLYTIDGAKIDEPGEMIQKGAYIFVPGGRKFNTKVWYYVPSYAKDTSTQSGDEGGPPPEDRPKSRSRSASPRSKSRGGSKDRR